MLPAPSLPARSGTAGDHPSPSLSGSAVPIPAPWGDADAAFFAEHLDRSDYARNLGECLRALMGGRVRSLIDVGAGSGVLGLGLIARGGHWTAWEPNAHMRGRLAAVVAGRTDLTLDVRADGWQALDTAPMADPADLVLCANIPGPIGAAQALHARTRGRGRNLAWVVPAQAGPRSWCLSGFLPDDLHGDDTTPGHSLCLDELGPDHAPDLVHLVDWRFRARFADHAAARDHMIDRLARRHGPVSDDLAHRLDRHLDQALMPADDGGVIAEAPKVSAILLWHG
ncbi:hypothetical protein GCM10011505_32750 [Tistrella bauzanensis]|uniref:SAM-dependent methyltransferase n=1 Tax=Tistrella bauzanensis TaxID=657419 RepID=A0ABQ1IR48_9PROT|nr:class I SAM-dependent methyltransferase [Tistrella bauzanensis]GGB49125.1 hypothetical protein GCM10011505_32750 [Tistrella bauzanensis]